MIRETDSGELPDLTVDAWEVDDDGAVSQPAATPAPTAVSEAVSRPVSETVSGNLPAVVSDSLRVRFPDHVGHAMGHWVNGSSNSVVQAYRQHGGLGKAVWHGQVESFAEHWQYVRGGEWVPPNHRDGWVIQAGGFAHHILFGFLLEAVGKWITRSGQRPAVFYGSVAFIGLIVLIIKIVT